METKPQLDVISFPFSETSESENEGARDSEYDRLALKVDGLELESSITSGFLHKKGEQRRNWKRRFFVLRPTKLCYYKDEKEYEILNIIPLNTIHSVSMIQLKKRQNVFGLVTKERTFYLQAANVEEMDMWIERIRACLYQEPKSNRSSVLANLPPTLPQDIPTRRTNTPDHYSPPLAFPPRSSEPFFSSRVSTSPTNASPPGHSDVSHSFSGHQTRISTDVMPNSQISNPSPLSRSFSTQERSSKYVFGSDDDDSDSKRPIHLGEGDNITKLQGFLEKLKLGIGKSKKLKRYWFVIRNGKLISYKNESEYEARRVLSLLDVIDVLEIDPFDYKGKPEEYCFKLVMPKSAYTFCASTKEEREEWIRVLSDTVGELKRDFEIIIKPVST